MGKRPKPDLNVVYKSDYLWEQEGNPRYVLVWLFAGLLLSNFVLGGALVYWMTDTCPPVAEAGR